MSKQDTWISAGVGRDAELPPDQLTEREQAELGSLMALRQSLADRLTLVEGKLEIFVLAVRDHRGLTGKVSVNPLTGAVMVAGDAQEG